MQASVRFYQLFLFLLLGRRKRLGPHFVFARS